MAVATLTIDLAALADNWRALDSKSAPNVETAAVVKADGYGLGGAKVATRLADAGARTFFVAAAQEGAAVRKSTPHGTEIYVFSGFSPCDHDLFSAHNLIPLLNSPQQVKDFLPTAKKFGIQLDTGMNRLGMTAQDFSAVKDQILTNRTRAGTRTGSGTRAETPAADESSAGSGTAPALIMSHLACADESGHPKNVEQLSAFHVMTGDFAAKKSIAATGGILLGANYHFNLTRPGIGLYGGSPFKGAKPVVHVCVPVIQTRCVEIGESVGYGAKWQAKRPSKIAIIGAGYADGLIRAMGPGSISLFSNDTLCPLVGRISMDLITVDITDLDHTPASLDILNVHQTVDDLGDAAGTIGYEILTSLGARYNRVYKG